MTAGIVGMGWEFYEPKSMDECLRVLGRFGPEACLLAGGTDLVIKLRLRAISPRAVVSLGNLIELKKLERKNDGALEMGPMITLREIETCRLLEHDFDLIRQGAGSVSSVQVRNMATLGGNTCNASPAADTVPTLIASGAEVQILEERGGRWLPLEKFFAGPGKTALQPGEILAGYKIPAPPKDSCLGGAYKKYAIRGRVDIAIVGVAARLTLDRNFRIQDARIVLGGVAPTPFRAQNAERVLTGCSPGGNVFPVAAKIAAEEAKPITDQRASAQYRKEMVEVWTRLSLEQAIQNARRKFPKLKNSP
jgi:CO/xanthine dehydrogenase FAD-binding subunit